MKTNFLIVFGLILNMSLSAKADVVDEISLLLKNNELCSDADVQMKKDAKAFVELFNRIKKDRDLEKMSSVVVSSYGGYMIELKNESSGLKCGLMVYDDCYSSQCE
jgi:hypothetical protein